VTQALLGHASITSTQVYLHPSAGRQRDAVDRLTAQRVPGSLAGRRL
jgi:site-specific recombinase XerD